MLTNPNRGSTVSLVFDLHAHSVCKFIGSEPGLREDLSDVHQRLITADGLDLVRVAVNKKHKQ